MTGQQRQPGNAVATSERQAEIAKAAKTLIETYRPQFSAVVPKHISVDAFVALAVAYVKRDPKLANAAMVNPGSVVLALRECAALGHVPMRKTFALVPFPDKNAPGGWSVVGMEEWRGVVERMYRGGGVTGVHVEVGRERDPVLRFNRTRDRLPVHEYDEFAPPEQRGPLKVVYAWADLLGGNTSYVVWMPRFEVTRHRAMSRSTRADGGGSFWGPADGEGPNTEAMWRKTALHALEGMVPTSAEYRWQLVATAQAATGWAGVPDRDITAAGQLDVVDAEEVPDDGSWPDPAEVKP